MNFKFTNLLSFVVGFHFGTWYFFGWYALLYIYALYMSVSYFFLRYPLLLHEKRVYKSNFFHALINEGKVATIAHRGGSQERLENTMTAFRNAVEKGIDVLELDVNIT